MHVEHIAIVLLSCILERWQDHRHPVILHEICECTDRLWSSVAPVDCPQLLRQNLHCFTACREFGNRSYHFRSPQTPERAVYLNYILPPTSYPKFSSSAPLEKHALLETSTSHRSSLFRDLDGPPSLFCVTFQCSPHVKWHAILCNGTRPTPILLPCGSASISQACSLATAPGNVCGCVRKPRTRVPAIIRLLRAH